MDEREVPVEWGMGRCHSDDRVVRNVTLQPAWQNQYYAGRSSPSESESGKQYEHGRVARSRMTLTRRLCETLGHLGLQLAGPQRILTKNESTNKRLRKENTHNRQRIESVIACLRVCMATKGQRERGAL
jgi:hypothetical protein